MPNPSTPTGVDFYVLEGWQDWQTWADKGVQFSFLKERQGDWTYDNSATYPLWFTKSWQGVKDAGMLRAPYLFVMPAHLTIPNVGTINAANWQNYPIDDVNPDPTNAPLPHSDGTKSLDYILAQTNSFCDEILAAGWGEPGDMPPAVDIEWAKYFTTAAVAVPGIGANDFPDLWQRLLPADRINALVVLVVQIENRLGVKPFIYCGVEWWEHINATDNGGAGYTVNHRAVQYQVQNFADYPLWCLARTTGTPGEAIIPATWAFRPAPAESRFIWQYAKDPDLSVVAQITATRPNPAAAQPNSVIATVTLLGTDVSYLEGLSKIVAPTAPRTLQRISPAPINPSPQASFNILLIGQSFNSTEWPDIANRVWTDPQHATSITDSAPFAELARSSRVACYADDGTGAWLRIRQVPNAATGFDDVLSISTDAAGRLQSYLAQLQIQGADGTITPANQVWLPQRRLSGLTGALVVILRNNRNPAQNQPAAPAAQAPGELYQLDPSENYPIPVVIVDVTWNDELWPQVVVRALAQNLAGLGDEFEEPGDAFNQPSDTLAIPDPPNLIRFASSTRALLPATAGGAVPDDIATDVGEWWNLAVGAPLDFYPDGSAPGALGGAHLIEGADGYRHNVMRSDFDCLMRRIPSSIATAITPAPLVAKIRDTIGFCRVCSQLIQQSVRGQINVRPGAMVRLDTQRIAYDWINWKNNAAATGFSATAAFNQTLSLAVPSTAPKWSMTIAYNPGGATIGDLFQIQTIQLAQRPGDPYAKAVDILKTLRFTNLTVTYSPKRGTAAGTPVTLKVHDAITNALDPPTLLIASDGGNASAYQVGAKLTLAWRIMSGAQMLFTVEAVLGLVLSGEDWVDPRSPTRGCHILPQFAMRVRRASKLVDAGGKVTVMTGSAVIDAVNAIAPDATLDPSIASIATGHLAASLVCESNRAGFDSVMGAPSAANIVTPTSGRQLAAINVAPPLIMPTDNPPFDWSWRYDHLRTFLAASRTAVGAYQSNEAKGQTTPVRQLMVTWPTGTAFQMTVLKVPKQGTYDAIIVHPVDTSATPVAPFPASGDLGLVLQMRYGLSGGNAFGNVVGWGTGRLDQGSATTFGSPLIPPNQHVDLTVNPVAAGQVTLTYAASVQAPQPNQYQVFLEQGLQLGYSYGIGMLEMPWLAWMAWLCGATAAQFAPLWQAAQANNPTAFDQLVRAFFHTTLHPLARNYDATRDNSTVQQAPEATAVPATVESL